MKNIESKMNEKKFRQVSRRELLKLTPVLALARSLFRSGRKVC